MYDKESLKLLKEFDYTTEGWGICTDGKQLFMSDGSERIYVRNPKTFDIIKTIEVYTNEFAIPRLNELEYVNGLIYANIWTSNEIAVIDPMSGKVIAIIDATNLVNEGKGNGEVLNGIAFHAESNKLYMTGKFWPTLFEVKVIK
jgi:glutamine cyclotransferase